MYKRLRERGNSHKPLRKAKSKAAKCKHKTLLVNSKKGTQKQKEYKRIITQYSLQWNQIKKFL